MNLTKLSSQVFILAAAVIITACDKEEFRSGGAVALSQKNFAFTCAGGGNSSNGDDKMTGRDGAKASIKGQFCLTDLDANPKEVINLAFTVDGSGSMKKADLGDGRTCERLKGAEGVLSKLINSGATDAMVKVGLVVFGNTAVKKTDLIGIVKFKNEFANFANFCVNGLGFTNYKDGFDVTRSILPTNDEKKYVLFFSDGIPEYSTGEKVQAATDGKESADALRAMKNLILKIAFMPVPNFPVDPTEYLNSLVAKPEDKQIAANAAGFVDAVAKLDIPTQVQGNSAVSAILRTPGFPDVPVQVTLKQMSATVFEYETPQFVLRGPAGQTTVNEIIVTAIGTDGKQVTSVSKISYTRTN